MNFHSLINCLVQFASTCTLYRIHFDHMLLQIRECKLLRYLQCWWQVQLKNQSRLYLIEESCDTLKPFSLFLFVKTIKKLIMKHSAKIQNIIIFFWNMEFRHFTLFYREKAKKFNKNYDAHKHSHCIAQ